MTAVSDTPDEAWATYQRAADILLTEGREALAENRLPG